MNLDQFFSRKYHQTEYNCLHFVAEVWKYITGQDFGEKFRGRDRFKRVPHPISPCIVIMQQKVGVTHAGVYLNQKVIHIHPAGVEFLPLEIATRGCKKLRFYQ